MVGASAHARVWESVSVYGGRGGVFLTQFREYRLKSRAETSFRLGRCGNIESDEVCNGALSLSSWTSPTREGSSMLIGVQIVPDAMWLHLHRNLGLLSCTRESWRGSLCLWGGLTRCSCHCRYRNTRAQACGPAACSAERSRIAFCIQAPAGKEILLTELDNATPNYAFMWLALFVIETWWFMSACNGSVYATAVCALTIGSSNRGSRLR